MITSAEMSGATLAQREPDSFTAVTAFPETKQDFC
jgi:hypothetical protein